MTSQLPHYYTTKQVAQLFNVRTWAVSEWCVNGELKAIKTLGPHGRWRIERESVEKRLGRSALDRVRDVVAELSSSEKKTLALELLQGMAA